MRSLVLVLVLVFCFESYSQINMGVIGGYYTENITFKNNPDIQGGDFSPGYNVGGFLRFRLLFISLQLDATWAQVKSEMTSTTYGNSNVELNKVDVPLWLNFHVFNFLRLGLGAQYSWRWTHYDTDTPYWNEMEANSNTGNWGLVFLGGVEFWRLMFNIDYRIGVTRYTTHADGVGGTNFYKTYPQTIALTVGFKFFHAKKEK